MAVLPKGLWAPGFASLWLITFLGKLWGLRRRKTAGTHPRGAGWPGHPGAWHCALSRAHTPFSGNSVSFSGIKTAKQIMTRMPPLLGWWTSLCYFTPCGPGRAGAGEPAPGGGRDGLGSVHPSRGSRGRACGRTPGTRAQAPRTAAASPRTRAAGRPPAGEGPARGARRRLGTAAPPPGGDRGPLPGTWARGCLPALRGAEPPPLPQRRRGLASNCVSLWARETGPRYLHTRPRRRLPSAQIVPADTGALAQAPRPAQAPASPLGRPP